MRDNFIFRQTFTPEMHRNWLKTKVATGEVVQYIIVDKAADTAVGSVYYRDVDHTFNSADAASSSTKRAPPVKLEPGLCLLCSPISASPRCTCTASSLRVLAENTPARRSYAAAGFVEEGTFRI